MSIQDKKNIKEIQSVLFSIKNGTPKFFNLTQYTKEGLVATKNVYGTDATGNKIVVDYKFELTAKSEMILNIAL